MPSVDTSDLQLIATMAAALAAIVAAITAAFIAGRMTRRAKIAEFRQEWINALRADIADYLAAVERYRVVYEGSDDGSRDSAIRTVSDETRPTYYRIVLRMNPWPNANQHADKKFLVAIESIVDANALPGRDSGFEDRIQAAVDQAQELLKREWEVTKGGWLRRRLRALLRKACRRKERAQPSADSQTLASNGARSY